MAKDVKENFFDKLIIKFNAVKRYQVNAIITYQVRAN